MFKYNKVTKSDYLNYYGVNLSLEIPDDDEPNNKVERYIWKIENYCNNMLSRYEYQPVTNNNLMKYKTGVMMMIYHSLKVGFSNLNGLTNEAYYQFRSGGFCNIPKGEINYG